jgi:alanine racemase
VVKADAYGHGAVEVTRALVGNGVRRVAVATAAEGARLRSAGISTDILVMADFLACEREMLTEHNLTPVLHTIDHIRQLSDIGAVAGRQLPFHLKIDSGLGRLGTREAVAEIVAALRSAPNVVFAGLMTHLASAEDFSSSQTADQLEAMYRTCAELELCGYRPEVLHLSASNAIAYGRRDAWRSLVRPGLSLYGYVTPAIGAGAPACVMEVKPALTWKTAAICVKELPAGVPVGYNARYRTTKPTRMAVLAAGYADGYPHRLGNMGQVIVNGRLAPLMGAVSMDLLTVDVTGCGPVEEGSAVTLLGREGDAIMDAQTMAGLVGTIPYAILCGIGSRVERVYTEGA